MSTDGQRWSRSLGGSACGCGGNGCLCSSVASTRGTGKCPGRTGSGVPLGCGESLSSRLPQQSTASGATVATLCRKVSTTASFDTETKATASTSGAHGSGYGRSYPTRPTPGRTTRPTRATGSETSQTGSGTTTHRSDADPSGGRHGNGTGKIRYTSRATYLSTSSTVLSGVTSPGPVDCAYGE